MKKDTRIKILNVIELLAYGLWLVTGIIELFGILPIETVEVNRIMLLVIIASNLRDRTEGK